MAIPPNVIIPVQIMAITSIGIFSAEMSRHPCVISTMPLKMPSNRLLSMPKTPEKNMLIEMIVGRRSLKGSDSVFVNGKDVSLSALAELFYKQFDFRRK